MRQELSWLSSLQRFPTEIGPCNDVVAMSAMAGLGNFVQGEKHVVYNKIPKVTSFLANNFLYQFHKSPCHSYSLQLRSLKKRERYSAQGFRKVQGELAENQSFNGFLH